MHHGRNLSVNEFRKKSILQTPLHRVIILYPRGHFCNYLSSGSPLTYQFSKPLNPLDYDPTYPRNPKTLGQYIRKYRKEKGLLIRELAEKLGIHEFTLIKWEGGRMPRYEKQIRLLRDVIPEVGRFVR